MWALQLLQEPVQPSEGRQGLEVRTGQGLLRLNGSVLEVKGKQGAAPRFAAVPCF